MIKYIKYYVLLALVFISCEDVIDVPVQTAASRLTVEASLDWEKGTNGNEQIIKLSTSTPFFETNQNTAVIDAEVKVTNANTNEEFVFTNQNNGEYKTLDFKPFIGHTYALEIIYKNEIYRATEMLNAVTDITNISQAKDDGFSEDELEVHIEFTDPIELGNNYLFKFKKRGELLPDLEVGDDEFVNGNEIDWWYEIEEDESTDKIEAFKAGDVVDIEMYAISEAYKNYISILIDQIGGVGLFEATPIAVKGNCINENNQDNFAYGYFRVTQVNKASYTFE